MGRNPLLDRRLLWDESLRELVREADVEGRTAGREIVAAPGQDRQQRVDLG